MEKNPLPVAKLLVSIVDHGSGETVSAILHRRGMHLQLFCLGMGTASSAILDRLGLGDTTKEVVSCLLPEEEAPAVLKEISYRMQMKKPGNGIAFTVPLSGICSLACEMLPAVQPVGRRKEGKRMEKPSQFSLVVAVVNQGYVETVMEAAREAGASGGTSLRARGAGSDGAERFLGVTLQPEKDVVAILAEREKKLAIMQAVNQAAGLKTEAQGIVLSLPVDELIGLSG